MAVRSLTPGRKGVLAFQTWDLQGQTVFDPDFYIDDAGLPHAKLVLPAEC